MSFVKSFTVKGVTYNAEMASALSQDEVQSFLTSQVVERAAMCAESLIELDMDVLVKMFQCMNPALKREVVQRLLHKTVIHGGKTLVSVDDFRGRLVEYNTLLAMLLEWNLADFFESLPSVKKDERAAIQNHQSKEAQ